MVPARQNISYIFHMRITCKNNNISKGCQIFSYFSWDFTNVLMKKIVIQHI